MASDSESGGCGCWACLGATYAILSKPVVIGIILSMDAACGLVVALNFFGVAPILACNPPPPPPNTCDIFFADLVGSRKGRNGLHISLLLYCCFTLTLIVPIVQFFGAAAVQWAYTKATGIEFGGEYIGNMIRNRLVAGILAALMPTIWMPVVMAWSLETQEEVLGWAWVCLFLGALCVSMANLLVWYLPWAPEAAESERQPLMPASKQEGDDSDDEETSGWFSKKKTSRSSVAESEDPAPKSSGWKLW